MNLPQDKKALAKALRERMKTRGRKRLPNEKRVAILGLYLAGELSMGDIALKVGVSAPTVKKTIDQAIAEGEEGGE